MADKVFDLVYVGAGSKCLINAMYASKYGGLKVGMFETRHEAGGGWCSDESPAPGFVANHCSHIHCHLCHHGSTMLDFPEWVEYGMKFAKPKVGQVTVFREDDSWVGPYTIWVEDYRDKTYNLMKRFSERDAETFLKLEETYQDIYFPALLEWMFEPPQPFGKPDALERLVMNPDAGIKPNWLPMSTVQLALELFESVELQSWGSRPAQSAGINPTAYGSALAGLFLMFTFMESMVIKGGTHQCAHASQRVIYENGGEIFHRAPVEKIIIENGRATGVRLADGTEVGARLGVVSGANPIDLVCDLTDPEQWPDDIARKVNNIERNFIAISWYTWALREQPVYKSESFDPDVRESHWLNLSRKGVEVMEKEVHMRMAGQWPDPDDFNLCVGNWSMFAHDYFAPPGGAATILTEQFVQPATRYSEAEWKEIEQRHADEIIKFWERYSPNVTWDNVIGHNPITPYYTAKHAPNFGPQGNWCVIDMDGPQLGRFRPIAELSDLTNFPIKNLYPCSAAWHPFGGAMSTQGRWVYKVIAGINGLTMPPEKDWAGMIQKTIREGHVLGKEADNG
ncbi:MAG: NAD(P)/FAD-dependent oxidoreductase [Thermodesulfobacteriota bacterium]|nr:NAD(P)/FAD-dependent oxidoreductase [Thermodesulfobacteriota bacterium]